MFITTMPPKPESKSLGFVSAHETILRQDMRGDRKLTDVVISELKKDAEKLGANSISGLRIQLFAFPTAVGLEYTLCAVAEATKL